MSAVATNEKVSGEAGSWSVVAGVGAPAGGATLQATSATQTTTVPQSWTASFPLAQTNFIMASKVASRPALVHHFPPPALKTGAAETQFAKRPHSADRSVCSSSSSAANYATSITRSPPAN